MNVVIDANILISGLRFGGRPRQILNLCSQGTINGFISDKALDEVKETLLTKLSVSVQEWTIIADAMQDSITIVPVIELPIVQELRDRNDLHILAAAEHCHAKVIVSGDKDLLTLKNYHNIEIMTVSDFIKHVA